MRTGLGWRPEIGAAILAHSDQIDVVEVLAEDFVETTAQQRRALRTLASCLPVVIHGTSLGLASTESVDIARLEAVARVIGWLEPESWSEHLAFVRAGGIEIGHLAAPPRNDETLEGLMRNVDMGFPAAAGERRHADRSAFLGLRRSGLAQPRRSRDRERSPVRSPQSVCERRKLRLRCTRCHRLDRPSPHRRDSPCRRTSPSRETGSSMITCTPFRPSLRPSGDGCHERCHGHHRAQRELSALRGVAHGG